MTLLEWNSLLSMEIHTMTTSMLTTCRCVLTLLKAALRLSVIASVSVNMILILAAYSLAKCHVIQITPHHIQVDVYNNSESQRKPNSMDVCVMLGSGLVFFFLFDRVTTPGRSLLQLRVLCPPQSKISGGWSGRRMYRPLLCWHAVTNRDEWVQTQVAANMMFTHIETHATVYVFLSVGQNISS